MNKIDLIIDALELAGHVPKGVVYPAGYPMQIAQALAAARELKAMKPVAWETFGLIFANGRILYHNHPKELPLDRRCRPLYALDGEQA